ncbi:MAG: TonB-dependent receptor [Flavobacteriales bacterium]|jgi:outer membrane cobalamin receptor|nr:TonB-dependent receptor [Flavobacteriales bacterium]
MKSLYSLFPKASQFAVLGKGYLLGFFFLLIQFSFAQEKISGNVVDQNKNALSEANVFWDNTVIGTVTDKQGNFSLNLPSSTNRTLVISHVGYQTQKLKITNPNTYQQITLEESNELEGVDLVEKRKGIKISNLKTVKVEQVSETELNKFACCDLAGSFATQQSVKTKTSNVITYARELQLLGVSGVYNQVMFDGFPLQQGLNYTYGTSGIAGPLINAIDVAKGANSVMQDYDVISGVIDVKLKKPNDSEKLTANMFINNFGENHWNVHYKYKGKGWSNLLSLNTVFPAQKTDNNDDGFMDLPQLNRFHVLNTVQFGNKKDWGFFSTTTFRYIQEDRLGGQMDFDKEKHLGGTEVYGQSVSFKQPEFWSKNIYKWDDDRFLSVNLSASYHDQKSYYGTTLYDAQQILAYAKAFYSVRLNEKSSYKLGAGFRLLDMDQDISFTENPLKRDFDGLYTENHQVASIFGEFKSEIIPSRMTMILGLRLDHHQEHGAFFVPRLLTKWDLNENSSLRASIGSGWRNPLLFPENIKVLSTGRNLVIDELMPEKALNYGLNFTQNFSTENWEGYLSADVYQTHFDNQVFYDYSKNNEEIIIKNLQKSRSRGGQIEISSTYKEKLDLKLSYTFTQNQMEKNEQYNETPFYVPHQFGIATSYRLMEEKLHLDLNAHFNSAVPVPTENPLVQGENYWLINGQVSYYYKKFKFYTGLENIFNYKQKKPILDTKNPFSRDFETAYAWGPIRGREWYLGITYRID